MNCTLNLIYAMLLDLSRPPPAQSTLRYPSNFILKFIRRFKDVISSSVRVSVCLFYPDIRFMCRISKQMYMFFLPIKLYDQLACVVDSLYCFSFDVMGGT